jgi:hypothetical protein
LPHSERKAFFIEKKAEARPAGSKKLLCLQVGAGENSAAAPKSFLVLFFKKEHLSYTNPL